MRRRGQRPHGERHEAEGWRVERDIEVTTRSISEDARRERPVVRSVLQLHIDLVPRGRAPWVGENTPVAECARTNFSRTGEPGEDCAADEKRRRDLRPVYLLPFDS